ncbi:MAG TPA: ABC-ATPase domain-containing protein [Longimicrobiaceae bacterium]|nr:ABC-ATPase domain-containing protein [Longimicrobiaceae bacterium]
MRTTGELERELRGLDGRGYRDYERIAGEYAAPGFTFVIDHVQGDPFADPSRVRALLPPESAGLPEWALRSPARRLAAADFLNRALHREAGALSSDRGSGKSGEIAVLRPGQEVLERSALRVGADGGVEARFRVGLPARGRTILGRAAAELLARDVPALVERALRFAALDADALRLHVETVEDARALREQLAGRGLVAWVADGARLPRASGIDDRPLPFDRSVPFRAPEPLRVALETPNSGTLAGMGIPAGVTLVVGGGFHGKSTLLRALERGVYDHLPGDGRERVVTVASAVKVRAEDGRPVAGTDISNFIGRIPGGGDTRAFRTANASGSTSQAAAIVEALEVGAGCLLLDEDTSATNFMIRDARMQALVADEPITPFVDRARQLHAELGVSTVLVVGGSGDYFDVADTVVAMRDFLPEDATARAKRIAEEHPTRRRHEGGGWTPVRPRVPLPASLDPRRGRHDVHVRARTEERVLFGEAEVELSAVEQLVETAQARAMGRALAWARGRAIDGRRDVAEALRAVMEALEREGLDAFQEEPTGELAAFRVHELAAFLGRIRSLETTPAPHGECGSLSSCRRGSGGDGIQTRALPG